MTATETKTSTLKPDPRFDRLASEAQLRLTAKHLESRGFRVLIARSPEEATRAVHDVLPAGAEVFAATSRTLDVLGISDEVEKSGRYVSVRARMGELAKAGEKREQRRAGQAPDWIIGSVHAVTEDGQVLVASNTGSQIGPYAYGAGNVVWVVGAQKIVADVDEGIERIREYSYPLEDARALAAYGVNSGVSKTLIVSRETQPGRVTIVLVHADLGF